MTIHTLCTNIQELAKWTAATVLELDLVRDIIGKGWLLYYITVLIPQCLVVSRPRTSTRRIVPWTR
jgi:hypothetical protein